MIAQCLSVGPLRGPAAIPAAVAECLTLADHTLSTSYEPDGSKPPHKLWKLRKKAYTKLRTESDSQWLEKEVGFTINVQYSREKLWVKTFVCAVASRGFKSQRSYWWEEEGHSTINRSGGLTKFPC